MEEIQRILEQEAEAIRNIPVVPEYHKIVELLFHQVHEKGGKIITSGMGKAGQVANNIATTFSSTGSPALFLHPSEAQHGDLGILRENDVLIVLSNSGKTREIIELVHLARQLYEKIKVVLITGNGSGVLPGKTDYTLYTGKPQEICPLGLTPTTSSTVMTVIGDALTVLLMKKIGFTAADYAKRHHGGYLGEKSRNNK
jgi:arabinose-5-phosphate isomerase